MPSCTWVSCEEATDCAMVGGCITQRFGAQVQKIVEPSELREDAKAFNGTKPARTNRDPRFIKRNRKALTK
jgi:hypothetical protein